MVRNRMHVMNWLWLACAVGGISGLEAGEPDFNVERAWQVNHDFERTTLAGNESRRRYHRRIDSRHGSYRQRDQGPDRHPPDSVHH